MAVTPKLQAVLRQRMLPLIVTRHAPIASLKPDKSLGHRDN
jgi:hypothetical protein